MGLKNRFKLKSFIFLILFILTCSFGCSKNQPAEASKVNIKPAVNKNQNQGGVDGGGGNYVGSEADQIKAIFHGDNGFNLKETIKSVFKIIEFQITNKFIDPELESIFSRMLGPRFSGDSFDIYKDIENSIYELKPSGPCLEDNLSGFKDASTIIGKKESSICFSLEGLKRLPIQAIPFQFIAIAVHEHAHHYGFDEIEAVKAQKQILKTMNEGMLNGIYLETINAAGEIRDHSNRLLNVLDTKISDRLICKHLSSVEATTLKLTDLSFKIENQFEMRLLITALDFQFMLTKKSFNGLDELKKLTREILTYCGEDPLVDAVGQDTVKEGERTKLKAHLEKIKFLANQIVQQITENSKHRKID